MKSHSGRWRVSVAVAALVMSVSASPRTFAEELTLAIQNGRVTLVAKNVPVAEILAEWARIGQTMILDGDKLTGAPISLILEDVPEARALATLLRSASGYLAAPRAAGSIGASRFDRILILPSSRAPVQAVSRAPAPRPQPLPGSTVGGGQMGAATGVPPITNPNAVGRPAGTVLDPNGQPLRQLLPQPPGQTFPQMPPTYPGNPFLQPPTDADPAPQTAPRPGIIINPPQSNPPPGNPPELSG